jgi:hypothetical protein
MKASRRLSYKIEGDHRTYMTLVVTLSEGKAPTISVEVSQPSQYDVPYYMADTPDSVEEFIEFFRSLEFDNLVREIDTDIEIYKEDAIDTDADIIRSSEGTKVSVSFSDILEGREESAGKGCAYPFGFWPKDGADRQQG